MVQITWNAIPTGPLLNLPINVPEAIAKRTTIIEPARPGATLTPTTQPSRGKAVARPDGTVALVLDHDAGTAGSTSFAVSEALSGHSPASRTVNVTITAAPLGEGWPGAEFLYMLPVDPATGLVTVTAHSGTRKVYVAPDSDGGMTAQEIATDAGVSLATVTNTWLRDNAVGKTYGASESKPLAPALAASFWPFIGPLGGLGSHWLLFKRGHTYADFNAPIFRGTSGISPVYPLYMGAWGTGARPILTYKEDVAANIVYANVVTQGLEFSGFRMVAGTTRYENFLFDDCVFRGGESSFEYINGLTIRNCSGFDAWRSTPPNTTTHNGVLVWEANLCRISTFYIANAKGVLLDGLMADHAGWKEGFKANGAVYEADGVTITPQPPSTFSHTIYMQASANHVTARDLWLSKSASNGAQFRGGVFAENAFCMDNGIGFNIGSGFADATKVNYALVRGALITKASYRGTSALHLRGSVDWGIRSASCIPVLMESIVAHAGDPDNPADASKTGASYFETQTGDGGTAPIFSDLKVRRWGPGDLNLGALSTALLDATTIQNYAKTKLSNPAATENDYIAHLRTLTSAQFRTELRAVLNYFRAAFGVLLIPAPRVQTATLTFAPHRHGPATRWDNRLNWTGDQLPIDGDILNIPANATVVTNETFSGTINLGAGATLVVNGGRIGGTINGPGTASVVIAKAGQVTATVNGMTPTNLNGGNWTP